MEQGGLKPQRELDALADDEFARYQLVAEYARDVILLLDPDGFILWASPSTFQILGRDPAALVGIHCGQHIHADDRERQRDVMRARVADRAWRSTELRVQHLDGSWIDIESVGVPISGPGGEIAHVVITGRDITARKAVERRLRESEQRMRLVMQQLPVNVWTTDEQLIVTSSMGGGLPLVGLAPDQLVGVSLDDYLRDEAGSGNGAELHRRALAGETISYEVTWRARDLFLSVQPLRDGDGGICGTIGLTIDITERKHAERRYQLLFERNLAGVFRSTVSGTLLDCNEAFARIFDSSAREMTGYPTKELYANPADRDDVIAQLAARGELRNFELKLRTASGQIVWALLNETLVPSANGDHILEGTIIDITARKLAEERMEYQAFHDSLTDLPNRFLLNDRLDVVLKQAKRYGRTVAVMFLDLDHFKLVNDTMAHTAGDELLRVVAERLASCLRADDTVARIGGDEFLFILPEVEQAAGAARVAQKVLEAVRQPLTISGRELYVTASIGIAIYPHDGVDRETLIRNADSAMYRAKELGRNMYQFHTPVTQKRAEVRLTLETALRRALERDEFELYYQPQVALATGRITRLEALIRWNRPGSGVVEPKDFIPLAEEIGTIVPMGEWVLRTACTQLRDWRARGFTSLGIAVNLSPRQFQHERLTAMVESAIEESDIPPQALELEITESLSMRDSDLTVGRLSHFRAMGIRVSLDDFGSGYSSLSHLRLLPIDTVKIDRSFITDLRDGAAEKTIVQAIVTMAQALELRVVAEGVETADQQRILTELGCDEIQGYIFSRPLPVAEIERLLA